MSGAPSLLNGSGDSVPVSASLKTRLPFTPGTASGSESRTSSAHGSHSTTFEDLDVDDMTQRPAAEGDDAHSQHPRSKSNKGNVLVSVRVRPNGSSEAASDGDWMVDGRQNLIAYRGKEGGEYIYDNVFSQHDGNAKLYEVSAKRLVRRVMEGYHGTVFAYGMTGTGKTFSMQGTSTQPGIIPQAVADIFSYIRETPHREFLLRASYLEIYNEEIRDLLAPSSGSGAPTEKIQLREDKKRGVYATPLQEEIVQSPMQLLRVISRGDRYRHTNATQYNIHSSRSHAVVKIVVESRERVTVDASGNEDKHAALAPNGVRISSLSMIDLAGSERAAESKERRTEGAHINKSLLTLGTVIARLNREKKPSGGDKDDKHLPYRDSKLTRLLQPALSGNSLISILCTIQVGSSGSAATASNNTLETINTLKFAARAKNNIVSHAKRNEEALSRTDPASMALLDRYRAEISALRTKVQSTMESQARAEEELARAREKEEAKEEDERHNDQLVELQLARTALNARIESLNRLILSSQSLGVNSSSASTVMSDKMSIYGTSVYGGTSVAGTRSIRSSASFSTLQRAPSAASQNTISTHLASLRAPSGYLETRYEANEGEYDESMGEGLASLQAQNKALQSDLADKTRYISTLEKRLIQARRSSGGPRSSMGVTISQIQEKDAEIVELRRQIIERDKTISDLRAAAPGPTPTATVAKTNDDDQGTSSPSSPHKHHASDSYGTTSSTATSNSTFSPVELAAKELSSLRTLPSAPPTKALPQLPRRSSNESGKSARSASSQLKAAARSSSQLNRQSMDELTRFLDGMIQQKVHRGEINGDAVQTSQRRSQNSVASQNSQKDAVPTVGALAKGLKWDDEDGTDVAAVGALGLGVPGVST